VDDKPKEPEKKVVELEEEVGDAAPSRKQIVEAQPTEDPVKKAMAEAMAAKARARMKKGRLALTFVNAKNVRRKDQTTAATNINPYLVAVLGKGPDPYNAKSAVGAGHGGGDSSRCSCCCCCIVVVVVVVVVVNPLCTHSR